MVGVGVLWNSVVCDGVGNLTRGSHSHFLVENNLIFRGVLGWRRFTYKRAPKSITYNNRNSLSKSFGGGPTNHHPPRHATT